MNINKDQRTALYRGRVSVCGSISHYNDKDGYTKVPDILPLCVFKVTISHYNHKDGYTKVPDILPLCVFKVTISHYNDKDGYTKLPDILPL